MRYAQAFVSALETRSGHAVANAWSGPRGTSHTLPIKQDWWHVLTIGHSPLSPPTPHNKPTKYIPSPRVFLFHDTRTRSLSCPPHARPDHVRPHATPRNTRRRRPYFFFFFLYSSSCSHTHNPRLLVLHLKANRLIFFSLILCVCVCSPTRTTRPFRTTCSPSHHLAPLRSIPIARKSPTRKRLIRPTPPCICFFLSPGPNLSSLNRPHYVGAVRRRNAEIYRAGIVNESVIRTDLPRHIVSYACRWQRLTPRGYFFFLNITTRYCCIAEITGRGHYLLERTPHPRFLSPSI